MTETEQVRETIWKTMPMVYCENCYLHHPGNYTREDCVTYQERPCALENVYIDAILSIPGVVVLAEDQHTPENPYDVGPYNYYNRGKNLAYDQAQEDMADWVKKAEGE